MRQVKMRLISYANIHRLNVLAVLVGLIAGYGAIGFRGLIGFLQNSFLYNRISFDLVSPIEHTRGAWIILIAPLGLLISTLLIWRFAREAKGSGIPAVMESVLARGGRMRKRLVLIKAFASSITIATGGSVGREGPIVQIGAAAASALGRLFGLKKRDLITLVGCGVTGAIAATFNTPIAGVIFAIELIILEFRARSFIPLVISAVFAAVVSRYYLGNSPALMLSTHNLINPFELIWYLGLGILCGVFGAIIIKFLYGTEDFFDKLKIPLFTKPIIGGLILGTTALFFPEILGVGYESVDKVLQEDMPLRLLLILAVLKMVMMSITIGAGGSGGVFAPSLFMGAMIGGAFGIIVHKFAPSMTATHGAYALVGMAALFSATSRATLTAIVMLFEMTLDYSIILPLMFACVVADQVAHFISKERTIFSIKLQRKGIDFVEGFGVDILKITEVQSIMTTQVDTLLDTMTIGEAFKDVSSSTHHIYPVINSHNILMGTIATEKIIELSQESKNDLFIKEIMTGSPCVVYPYHSAYSAMKKLQHCRDPRVVVVNPNSKKLLGIVCPSDIIRLAQEEVEE